MRLPLQWEFPGGKVEQGENIKSALARELLEELNLDVVVGDIFETSFHEESGIKLIAIECETKDIRNLILNEHSAYEWLAKHELSHLNWAEADLPIVKKLSNE
jgi:8-oxo-dGTP diphosphatase